MKFKYIKKIKENKINCIGFIDHTMTIIKNNINFLCNIVHNNVITIHYDNINNTCSYFFTNNIKDKI